MTFKAAIAHNQQQNGRDHEAEEQSNRAEQSSRGQHILAILRERGSVGSAALLAALGESITQRALQNELRRLREAGLVVAAGKARATTYRLKKGGQ